MTPEEASQVIRSDVFLKFFTNASKLMEVAITEDIAIGRDNYTEDLITEDGTQSLALHRIFYDEKWSKGRAVTSLDW